MNYLLAFLFTSTSKSMAWVPSLFHQLDLSVSLHEVVYYYVNQYMSVKGKMLFLKN